MGVELKRIITDAQDPETEVRVFRHDGYVPEPFATASIWHRGVPHGDLGLTGPNVDSVMCGVEFLFKARLDLLAAESNAASAIAHIKAAADAAGGMSL